jgi:4-hydroxyphenylpyruvate dioxygenase
VTWASDAHGGRWGAFEITTPFGEATFRFVQREGFAAPAPGFDVFETPRGGNNRFGFEDYDHVTSNFLTLKPMELWCKQVLGLAEYWGIAFHTDDVPGERPAGSGLKSVVLWDPHSGVKFANNEPLRPHFDSSQIYVFVVDNHGDGIQHAALSTRDIVGAVEQLIERGVAFMPTPGSYYDMLPERLVHSGIGHIDEDVSLLRRLGILVDGREEHQYLLQIFLKEAAGLYDDDRAGPFFFEIIERKGDRGFGGGNFRALFESIERDQRAAGRV